MHEDRLLARKLTEDLMRLRDWMKGLERRIARPVLMQDSSEKEYRKKRKEYTVSFMSSFSGGRCKSFVSHLIGYLLFSFFLFPAFFAALLIADCIFCIPRIGSFQSFLRQQNGRLFSSRKGEGAKHLLFPVL